MFALALRRLVTIFLFPFLMLPFVFVSAVVIAAGGIHWICGGGFGEFTERYMLDSRAFNWIADLPFVFLRIGGRG